MSQPTIITIDGPAGSGKSTVAKALATRLGFSYLDTGAMYRAVALVGMEAGLSVDDGPGHGALAQELDLRRDAAGRTWIGKRDVSEAIRTPEISDRVSPVSAHPQVREAMTRLQRRVGEQDDLVGEGRDLGSVVFPDAQVKIYLDASPEVRAQRRHAELRERGTPQSFSEVLAGVIARDHRDATREVAPLKKTEEHVLFDCSKMGIEEVVTKLASLVADRLRSGKERELQ